MKKRVTKYLALAVATGIATGLPAKEEGWQPLFDGKSIESWVQRGGKAEYKVEDNAIVGTTVHGTPNSFLCTPRNYSDFVLEFEVMVDPKLNSGVQFRSQSLPEYKDGRVHGYQLEIDPSERAFSGGIYDESRRGWLADLKDNQLAKSAFKKNDWNKMRLEARGDTLCTWVNGTPAVRLIDSVTTTGFIALQVHSTTSTVPMNVKWRNLQIRELTQPANP